MQTPAIVLYDERFPKITPLAGNPRVAPTPGRLEGKRAAQYVGAALYAIMNLGEAVIR